MLCPVCFQQQYRYQHNILVHLTSQSIRSCLCHSLYQSRRLFQGLRRIQHTCTGSAYTMGNAKTLAISHSLVFFAGFAVGKFIDHEELSIYRELHEGTMGKWRRRAGAAALGVVCLGTTVFLVRATSSMRV
jgi:hypothetical protein